MLMSVCSFDENLSRAHSTQSSSFGLRFFRKTSGRHQEDVRKTQEDIRKMSGRCQEDVRLISCLLGLRSVSC